LELEATRSRVFRISDGSAESKDLAERLEAKSVLQDPAGRSLATLT
jgi:hypothetical protein